MVRVVAQLQLRHENTQPFFLLQIVLYITDRMFLCDSRGIKGLEKLKFSQSLSWYWYQGPGGALTATLLPVYRVVGSLCGLLGCDEHAAFWS